MADGFNLTGVSRMIASLKAEEQKTRKKVADELYQEGLRIMEISQKRVPVATGDLKKSGQVTLPTIASNGDISMILSYGDEGVLRYAIPVHERLGVRHPVGQAKYLESVLNEEAPNILRNIAENMEDTGF